MSSEHSWRRAPPRESGSGSGQPPLRHAIRLGATGVVLSHNHICDTGPSAADRAVTRRLVAAGHLLGLPLLASLVVEPGSTHDLVSERSWCSG